MSIIAEIYPIDSNTPNPRVHRFGTLVDLAYQVPAVGFQDSNGLAETATPLQSPMALCKAMFNGYMIYIYMYICI